jgi:hypothetical protein
VLGPFRKRCAAQRPLGGWPAVGMSLWDRVRMLGHALENNCVFRPPSRPGRPPRPPAPKMPAGGGQMLRILSLNTWCSHFIGGPRRGARLQLVVDHLEEAEYDVCVFQELFTFGLGPAPRPPVVPPPPPPPLRAFECKVKLTGLTQSSPVGSAG